MQARDHRSDDEESFLNHLRALPGRFGYASDLTYDITGEFKLMQTVVFNFTLNRYETVLVTLCKKMDRAVYQAHFGVHFANVHDTDSLRRRAQSVLDFNTAQRAGFIKAFVDAWCRIAGQYTLVAKTYVEDALSISTFAHSSQQASKG